MHFVFLFLHSTFSSFKLYFLQQNRSFVASFYIFAVLFFSLTHMMFSTYKYKKYYFYVHSYAFFGFSNIGKMRSRSSQSFLCVYCVLVKFQELGLPAAIAKDFFFSSLLHLSFYFFFLLCSFMMVHVCLLRKYNKNLKTEREIV